MLLLTESDRLLLDHMRSGDGEAFERLFLRYYPPVFRVLYNLVGKRESAEDLAQETFLELYRHTPYLGEEPGATILSWLCRVALNRGYNTLRGEQRERQRLERMAERPNMVDPEAELLRSEEHAEVHGTLARLPERQIRILSLRYAGLSYSEIARALDIAPGSVGTLLARAERAFAAVYNRLESLDTAERTDL
jgi:RNA polymerase sigma-70 factor (ECF subfamily)